MKIANVYRNEKFVGILTQHTSDSYEFQYCNDWFTNDSLPAISLTLPKSQKIYTSDHLFPFFFNILSEGVNRKLQCRQLKIDETDYFGLLLATASIDTVGAITVKPEMSDEE